MATVINPPVPNQDSLLAIIHQVFPGLQFVQPKECSESLQWGQILPGLGIAITKGKIPMLAQVNLEQHWQFGRTLSSIPVDLTDPDGTALLDWLWDTVFEELQGSLKVLSVSLGYPIELPNPIVGKSTKHLPQVAPVNLVDDVYSHLIGGIGAALICGGTAMGKATLGLRIVRDALLRGKNTLVLTSENSSQVRAFLTKTYPDLGNAPRLGTLEIMGGISNSIRSVVRTVTGSQVSQKNYDLILADVGTLGIKDEPQRLAMDVNIPIVWTTSSSHRVTGRNKLNSAALRSSDVIVEVTGRGQPVKILKNRHGSTESFQPTTTLTVRKPKLSKSAKGGLMVTEAILSIIEEGEKMGYVLDTATIQNALEMAQDPILQKSMMHTQYTKSV